MLARTLLQPAYPVTFGFKAANWLIGVLEARRMLRVVRREGLAVQLGGPVGTMGGFGGQGSELVALLARELELCVPELPWHSNRGRVGALASSLSLAAAAAAKIALDIILLSQAEVGEVAEGAPGGSSSMSHKRNSARAILARAAFSGLLGQTGVLPAGGAGEHERAAGSLQAEWPALSEALRLSAGAVARSREALSGLHVDATRMAANLRFAGVADPPIDPADAVAIVDRALEIFDAEEKNK
jgi:3-carboxy-cis,cis-muconate cycloisomerase